ncbi:hypothetical protein [Bradyrhizobium sp. STM 3557]|uniref:SctD/MshK family protein n=1 Tax=Bradyrhizobium sp. STM 3557 TaxID=578920 RepID=UPI00388E2FB2
MAIDASAVLVVESGVHQTASAALVAGRNRVGHSGEDDIVISDLRDGACFALENGSHGIVLHAIDGPIEISGRRTLKPGQSRRCANDARFRSGGVAFRLEIAPSVPDANVESMRAGSSLRMPILAAATLAAVALAGFVSFRPAPAVLQSNDETETTGSIPAASSRDGSSVRQKQLSALESLRQHLATVDLGALALTARPDGAIEARGEISREQEAAWRDVEHWFDGIVNGQVVLVNAVSVGATPKPLAVQAVWPGQNPYVIDGDGNKHFIGSVLPSGWTVAAIDESHVLVKRGQQTLAVRF